MDNEKLVEKIKDYMKEFYIPGVAVGIKYKEDTFTEGLGITNVEHPMEVDESTLFQIGSITKTFVATLAMRLVEMGKLDLNVPIRTYLPDFKVFDEETSAMVTMYHLFTHTAGWVGDWFPKDLGHGEDAVARYVGTMVDTPQLTPLGKVLSYNNAGFNVAGRVFEIVLGKVFSDIMQEMLFDPLEMTHTYLLPWDLMTHRFTVGHSMADDNPSVARPWSIGRASGPAGGIVTNVKDMLNYSRFQLGDGTFNGNRLLEPESLEKMHFPQVKFTSYNSVALAFWVDERRAVRTIGHGGGTVGQTSLLTIVPDHDFSILLVTNSGNGRQLNPKVTDYSLEHYLGVSTPKVILKKMSKDQLAEYEGEYKATLTAAEVNASEGTLSIRRRSLGGFPTKDTPPASVEPTPPVQYGFYDEDHIVGLDNPNKGDFGQFLRNPDGNITWLRLGMRIHRPRSLI